MLKQKNPINKIDESYANIAKYQPIINALITIRDRQDVLNDLKTADPKSPLYGVTYVMKDAYVTKDIRTTAASKCSTPLSPPTPPPSIPNSRPLEPS